MTDQTPLKNIPEIVRNVAQFSDKAQLANAALVCKSWNSIFSRELYSSLEWHGVGGPRNPEKQVITDHAADVRSVIFKGDMTQEFPSRDLTQLKSIQVSTPMWCPNTFARLPYLLRRNSRLQSFRFNIGNPTSNRSSSGLLGALLQCPVLKDVQLSRLNFRPVDIEPLFRLCGQLHNLSVENSQMVFHGAGEEWPSDFPFLQTLRLDGPFEVPTKFMVKILGRCSVLEHLSVDLRPRTHQIPVIGRAIEADCPNLHKLTIVSDKKNLLPDDLAPMIHSCQRLTFLTITKSGFGPTSFDALRRHFQGLVHIDVEKSADFKSQNVQEVMASCPQLTTLKAYVVYDKDITEAEQWVCTRLENLTVFISKIDSSDTNNRIMQKLAGLSRLRVLDVGSQRYHEVNRRGLSFGLGDGLNHLSTLTQLHTLRFIGLRQQLVRNDVQWMLNSWPHLSAVYGVLHTSEYQRPAVENMLRNRNINLQ
ncbi:hypothetical protein BGX21_007139 [Mortierella sp. AD011]|nr:hypothetical protein BGX20_007179 [Mortierella sp. AD010]KAF9398880.1 hypothetical protein BGX21_007139 [Mortierella sp. AD011]